MSLENILRTLETGLIRDVGSRLTAAERRAMASSVSWRRQCFLLSNAIIAQGLGPNHDLGLRDSATNQPGNSPPRGAVTSMTAFFYASVILLAAAGGIRSSAGGTVTNKKAAARAAIVF